MLLLRQPFSKFLRGACLAGLIATGHAQSVRAEETITETRQVSATGFDLSTPDGRAQLLRRVRIAAYKVCGEDDGDVSLDGDAFRQCVSDAMRGALPQVQSLFASAQRKNTYAAASPSRP